MRLRCAENDPLLSRQKAHAPGLPLLSFVTSDFISHFRSLAMDIDQGASKSTRVKPCDHCRQNNVFTNHEPFLYSHSLLTMWSFVAMLQETPPTRVQGVADEVLKVSFLLLLCALSDERMVIQSCRIYCALTSFQQVRASSRDRFVEAAGAALTAECLTCQPDQQYRLTIIPCCSLPIWTFQPVNSPR